MRKRVGKYNIQQPDRPIGHGQSAAVYLATHIDSPQEIVALKFFHVFAPEKRVQRTFLRETEIITRLNHSHIIRVLYVGFDKSNPYYVMGYAPGGNLRSKVKLGTRLSPEEVDVYLQQIANAIQHVHNNGLVHCDLKPENILIAADGTMLLADFGITRSIQTIQAQSTQGAAGTPLYMAPEQFLGRPDIASDQYSLGVLIYELLAGSPPFKGNNAFELMSPHLNDVPPSLTPRNPAVSPRLEAVIFRALEKKPENRFPSVSDFAQAFHEVVYELAEVAPIVYGEAVKKVTSTDFTNGIQIVPATRKVAIGQRLRREQKRRGVTQEALLPELSLPDKKKVQDVPQYDYNCFISYANEDLDFAKKLYEDLQKRGVRCWFAPNDLRPGELLQTAIEKAIRASDIFLLIFSGFALGSLEVEIEVRIALRLEQLRQRDMIFPIYLDESITEATISWAATIKRTHLLGNFVGWKRPGAYQLSLDRLLRDLRRDPIDEVPSLSQQSVQFYTCMIIYCEEIISTATNLLKGLETLGIRCGFESMSMKSADGSAYTIRSYDKLVFLFSENSQASFLAEIEVEEAFKRETTEKRDILIPICLGDLGHAVSRLPLAMRLAREKSIVTFMGNELHLDEVLLETVLKLLRRPLIDK